MRINRNSPKLSITIPPDILADVVTWAKQEKRTLSNAISYLTELGIQIEKSEEITLQEAETKKHSNPYRVIESDENQKSSQKNSKK